jgi:hypothetical protein
MTKVSAVTRTVLAIATAATLLAGCLGPPAKREDQLTSFESCRARCNRQDQICADEASVNKGAQRPVGGAALCQSNLEACLNRCGATK